MCWKRHKILRKSNQQYNDICSKIQFISLSSTSHSDILHSQLKCQLALTCNYISVLFKLNWWWNRILGYHSPLFLSIFCTVYIFIPTLYIVWRIEISTALKNFADNLQFWIILEKVNLFQLRIGTHTHKHNHCSHKNEPNNSAELFKMWLAASL